MVSLFGWRRKAASAPTLTPRSEPRDSIRAASGSTHTLAPERRVFLGRAAYFQLIAAAALARAAEATDSLVAREAVSLATAEILSTHHGLTAELVQMRADPLEAMEQHRAELDAFAERTRSADWRETLLAVYLCDGLLIDLFVALAPGIGSDGARYAALLSRTESAEVIVGTLAREIEQEPRLAGRLALWGRRLTGDALLLARGTLNLPAERELAEIGAAAATADLVAGHTRRMDRLGLTA